MEEKLKSTTSNSRLTGDIRTAISMMRGRRAAGGEKLEKLQIKHYLCDICEEWKAKKHHKNPVSTIK